MCPSFSRSRVLLRRPNTAEVSSRYRTSWSALYPVNRPSNAQYRSSSIAERTNHANDALASLGSGAGILRIATQGTQRRRIPSASGQFRRHGGTADLPERPSELEDRV